jgi:protein SCO1/2
MKYLKQTLLYSAITLVFILAGVGLYQTFASKPKTPVNAKVYPAFKPMSHFSLQSGESSFTEQNFKGYWSLVFFGYTYCPDVCPTTMAALREFYSQLPPSVQQDTQIILVSVDPERDDPQRLQEYASAFHPNFIGVTGSLTQLESFARQFGAVFYNVGEGDDYLVDHTAKIFLVDPKGLRHAFFDKSLDNPSVGFEFNIPQMVADYLIIRDTQ